MAATLLVVDDNPDKHTVRGELLAPHDRALATNCGMRALGRMLAVRGRHFDPDVVDALLVQFEAFCAIAARQREAAADGTAGTAA